MNFFDLALNNIKKKFGSYFIYLASTVFAVTLFYIFCSLYFNPQFSVYRFGTGKMAVLFKASAIAVILFSSVFVFYANKFFVKTRKKEIAIYSLLGMKKDQIGRMLFYENFIIGIIAVGLGILVGSIFSRFFSMLLLKLMAAAGTKVTFTISIQAVIATVIAFLILFIINSLNAYSTIYRNKLIELLAANKEGEKTPKYSIAGGLISTLLIIAGYIIALTVDVNKGGFQLMLPAFLILCLIVLGTVLFFKNFIPMAVLILKKNKHFYYKPANFIGMSQIIYRIKANSSMLAIIAVLSAAAMTLMSSTFSMYRGLETTIKFYSPFSYTAKNVNEEQFKELIKTIEKRNEVKVTSSNRFDLIKAKVRNEAYSKNAKSNPNKLYNAYIISQSDYKAIIKNTGVEYGKLNNLESDFNIDLKNNECYFIDKNSKATFCENIIGSNVNLSFLQKSDNFKITGVSLHKYIGLFELSNKVTIVLSDSAFKAFRINAGKDDIINFTGLMFDNPLKSENTVKDLNRITPVNKIASNMKLNNINYIETYKDIFAQYGAYVFIGMFLGILFLLATGSILYYKQIIEAREEATRYDILRKTGMSVKEIKQSISKQLAIVFGMPLIVGLIHSVIAILTYNRTMDTIGKDTPTLLNAAIIAAIYVVIYCFYYFLSVNNYMKIACYKKR